MIPIFLVAFVTLISVPNVTPYRAMKKNNNFEMLKEGSRTNLWDVINKWQWMNLQNDFNQRRIYQELFANEPAPMIKIPYRPNIIDPRTVNQPTAPNNFEEKPLIIKDPFRATIIDPRTVNQQSKPNTNIEPKNIYPSLRAFVDPRSTIFVNEQAPLRKYPFPVGFVDPRTTMLIDEPAPVRKYPYPAGIVDPRTTVFIDEPKPEIKYPFPEGMIDPRTVDIKPSLSINERAPIIKYRF